MTAPHYTGEVTDDGGVHEWGAFRYAMTGSSYPARKVRTITLLAGEWPTVGQLITLADGDDPAHPSHFGGFVEYVGPNVRLVTVYTD